MEAVKMNDMHMSNELEADRYHEYYAVCHRIKGEHRVKAHFQVDALTSYNNVALFMSLYNKPFFDSLNTDIHSLGAIMRDVLKYKTPIARPFEVKGKWCISGSDCEEIIRHFASLCESGDDAVRSCKLIDREQPHQSALIGELQMRIEELEGKLEDLKCDHDDHVETVIEMHTATNRRINRINI